MKAKRRRSEPHILAAVFLSLCLGAAFFFASREITALATDSCFRMLRQATLQFGQELKSNVSGSRQLLKLTARQFAELDGLDSEPALRLLSSFEGGSLISRLEILLPGDQILSMDGSLTDASDALSYEREKALGEHISGRQNELDGSGMILRSYAPIVKDGETQALLCAVIDLETLPHFYSDNLSQEGSRLCVIEGKSGNFLVDTVHDYLGNIHGLRSRKIKEGYSLEQVIRDMDEGKSGQTAFFSNTAGEYLYCAYEPAGINDWMLMFSLPESVALADAQKIRRMLMLLAGLEALFLVFYFVWLLLRTRRETREKDAQLDRVQYMLQIENVLFNAARDPGLFEEALHKVAGMLQAQGAFFLLYGSHEGRHAYVWTGGDDAPNGFWENLSAKRFPRLSAMLTRQGSLVCYDFSSLAEESPREYELLQGAGVESLMLVSVRTPDSVHAGVLGAYNLGRRFSSAELLQSVVLSFSMALYNMESFLTIKEMGMMDHLTGLLNRNSFQKAMEEYEKGGNLSLCCVYLDADGLHEINNQFGHIAGDRMLQSVAEARKECFGEENTYRIGGDEFAAFCLGEDEEQVGRRIQALERAIADCGYHVSLGVERRERAPLVFEMVKRAEEKMYEAKRLYYQNRDGEQQAREMNRQLEDLLQEKRDLDVFRSALASKYIGVYIVDLRMDSLRTIYIPAYFQRAVQAAGGKFSAALQSYAEKSVDAMDRKALLALLDYQALEKRLGRGEEPQLLYRKKDGECIFLHIFPSPDYSPQCRECIWTFEKTKWNEQ